MRYAVLATVLCVFSGLAGCGTSEPAECAVGTGRNCICASGETGVQSCMSGDDVVPNYYSECSFCGSVINCEAGVPRPCMCAGGGTGMQQCNATGIDYTACDCGGMPDAAGQFDGEFTLSYPPAPGRATRPGTASVTGSAATGYRLFLDAGTDCMYDFSGVFSALDASGYPFGPFEKICDMGTPDMVTLNANLSADGQTLTAVFDMNNSIDGARRASFVGTRTP